MKWEKPKKRARQSGGVLLKGFLNPAHPLYRLAGVVNWGQFERQFGQFYAEGMGRPALATRLLVGLHYLTYLYNVSDEVVVASGGGRIRSGSIAAGQNILRLSFRGSRPAG